MQSSSADLSPESLKAAWHECLEDLKSGIDNEVFDAYLNRLEYINFDVNNECLILDAPSNLIVRHIENNYAPRITSLFAKKLSLRSVKLKVTVPERRSSDDAANRDFIGNSPYVVVKKVVNPIPPAGKSSDPSEQILFGQRPNPKYTFDNFVVGTSNQFCHAAAMQVAEKPGESYNPLFIYGGVGLGKTHLMHAIGNAVLKANPNRKVLYLSSETFTNVLIQSLRAGKMDDFKNRMRGIEVLLIDDIQFMRGKETTQEEFFHTFNALYSSKHQIVITCDKNPVEIPDIEERLSTRFAWGLIADLQAPDFETRVAILKEKATRERFSLPEDCANFIAHNFASNVRELEGALTRLHAVSSLQNKTINIELANSALKSLLQPKVTNISVDQIKKVVATHFGIKVSDMVSKRRNKNLAFPRHIAMYLCRKHTAYSYPEIGQSFGGRDHSSVIHAANTITTKVQANSDLKDIVESLERSLLYAS